MRIISDQITNEELGQMAEGLFGDMVKAVVDVERKVIAVDAELHADLEAALLEDGSRQKDLWGINFYPELQEGFVEFDSMINIKPSQGNKSRGVSNEETRAQILEIVAQRVKR